MPKQIYRAVTHKWALHMLSLIMFRLQFGWSHSAKFWQRYHGYNGTYKKLHKIRFLVTLTKGRAVFVLTKCYAGSLAPMNRHGLLHLYRFLDSYLATWLYPFYSLSYGVFTARTLFEFRGYRLVAPSRFTTFGNSPFPSFWWIRNA